MSQKQYIQLYTLPHLDIKATYNKKDNSLWQTLERELKETHEVRSSSTFNPQDYETSKVLTKNVDRGRFFIAHTDVPKKQHSINDLDLKIYETEKKLKYKRENAVTKTQIDENSSYRNTYMLDPVYPVIGNKVISVIKNEVLRLKEVTWPSPGHLCLELSNNVKNKLKVQKFSRYKYIVTVTFGDLVEQGLKIASLFFWDAQRDNYFSETFSNNDYFITVCVYAVYFD